LTQLYIDRISLTFVSVSQFDLGLDQLDLCLMLDRLGLSKSWNDSACPSPRSTYSIWFCAYL